MAASNQTLDMTPSPSPTSSTTTSTNTTTTTTSSEAYSYDPIAKSPLNLVSIAKSISIKTTLKAPSSDYNSPALSSAPSSAFASALQSPYISPRAAIAAEPEPETRPVSRYSSHRISEFVPSSFCTPPPERSDSSTTDQEEKSLRASDQPRISFSFPVIPRVSFANARASSVSTSSVNGGTKLRSCDVFIGYHGQSLARLSRWLKSELEVQGIACFVADRARYADSQSHEIADRVICSASYGIVVVSNFSLGNRFSLEEFGFFGRKRNLVPVLVDLGVNDIIEHLKSVDDKETREAIDELVRSHGVFKLEANGGEWRSCIVRASIALTSKLGRKSMDGEKELISEMEFPFPRNKNFVGREKEIAEMEMTLFSSSDSSHDHHHLECPSMESSGVKGSNSGQSEGFADEETAKLGVSRGGGRRYISLEMARSSNSEAWSVETRRSSMKRTKYKKSRSGKDNKGGIGCSMVCINGAGGIGKTELALEFAYRHLQRYKMVLWVRGEVRYMRQNILNLAVSLGLDLSADVEKERGRIRSFEEQEHDAFKRIKRELFKDVPYLIIIDNLEDESEWWEGKDLPDLIPRNTGGSHVIVTTRLSRVMNSDPALQLNPLPLSDVMLLIRGRRCKDFQADDLDFLKKFNEKLGGSTFGLWIVACLLSELLISPSALYEAVEQCLLEDVSCNSSLRASDPFLMKLLGFCFDVLEKASKRRNCLASRMLLIGSWFAPAPISATMLAAAAKSLSSTANRLTNLTQCLNQTVLCSSGCYLTNPSWKNDESSALMLAKLGLARKCTRQPGPWIQFHPITTQAFTRRRDQGLTFSRAAALAIRKSGNPLLNSDHLWASAHLVFGFKSEPPVVQLKPSDMAVFIKKTALPLAIWTFTTFSRCNSALELLKVCTSVLDEVEKSFVSQAQDWWHGSLCWKKRVVAGSGQRMDEYIWQDVTLLKATLLETRAKLLLRGGQFDGAEELCRMCTSIRTVMLGHSHPHTLAAQQTLAKLVRLRSKVV